MINQTTEQIMQERIDNQKKQIATLNEQVDFWRDNYKKELELHLETIRLYKDKLKPKQ